MILKVLEPLSPQKEKQTETQIYLKVCLLFLFARMPAAAQGMDKVNPSLRSKGCKSSSYEIYPLFYAQKTMLGVFFLNFWAGWTKRAHRQKLGDDIKTLSSHHKYKYDTRRKNLLELAIPICVLSSVRTFTTFLSRILTGSTSNIGSVYI